MSVWIDSSSDARLDLFTSCLLRVPFQLFPPFFLLIWPALAQAPLTPSLEWLAAPLAVLPLRIFPEAGTFNQFEDYNTSQRELKLWLLPAWNPQPASQIVFERYWCIACNRSDSSTSIGEPAITGDERNYYYFRQRLLVFIHLQDIYYNHVPVQGQMWKAFSDINWSQEGSLLPESLFSTWPVCWCWLKHIPGVNQ